MVHNYHRTALFKEQVREALQREIGNSRALTIPKHANVSTIGEQDEWSTSFEGARVKLKSNMDHQKANQG